MRLWHEKLIPYLPRQQLLGQHRRTEPIDDIDYSNEDINPAGIRYIFQEELGYYETYDSNGWEQDTWYHFYNDYEIFSMYYCGYTFELKLSYSEKEE